MMARVPAATQGPAEAQDTSMSRPTRQRSEKGPVPSMVFDIPYFADMQLNPARYPFDVGIPVGKPPYEVVPYGGHKAKNGAKENTWDESDEDVVSSDDGTLLQKRKLLAPIACQNGFSGSDYKKAKMSGGRPALAKKVTAEMDSDDELIVKMKQAKYQEKEIAQRLINEGRTHYHAKTIGTRWARLKKAMQARNDQLLDQDLTDWHDGDDEVLAQAIAKADAEIEKIKHEIEGKKWRMVADKMKVVKPVVNFSQNACRKRYEELQAGTAKPTPESIKNPNDHIKARIRSRTDKEEAIEKAIGNAGRFSAHHENMDKNGWTSRMRD